jgi:hypothetical protein
MTLRKYLHNNDTAEILPQICEFCYVKVKSDKNISQVKISILYIISPNRKKSLSGVTDIVETDFPHGLTRLGKILSCWCPSSGIAEPEPQEVASFWWDWSRNAMWVRLRLRRLQLRLRLRLRKFSICMDIFKNLKWFYISSCRSR